MTQRKGKKPGPKSSTDKKRLAALKKARAAKKVKTVKMGVPIYIDDRRSVAQEGQGIRDFFNGIRSGYKAVETAGKVTKAYEDAAKGNKAPPLPPKRADQKAAPVAPVINPIGINNALKKYRPISAIDGFLGDIGARNYVRSKLNSSALGKQFVTGADTLMKFGLGEEGGAFDVIKV